jgi:lipopolysaccharide biosynthesis glycosyltransferase
VHLLTDLSPQSIKIKKLTIDHYKPSSDWYELEKLLTHPKEFRDNFWFTSLSRFIAISEFFDTHQSAILHLESDVIISKDFPFDKIITTDHAYCFPIVSDTLAIASTLFIKNSDAAKYLAKLALKTARTNSDTTDMHILRLLSREATDSYLQLPSSPSVIYDKTRVGTDFLKNNEYGVNYFKGLFDGFDIGRYLFGVDPRNGRGISKIREFDDSVYLDMRKLQITIDKTRDFPYVLDIKSNNLLPVYSLHIHSKNKRFFTSSSARYIKRAVNNKSNVPSIKIYPAVFVKSFFVALRRRLKKYFSN